MYYKVTSNSRRAGRQLPTPLFPVLGALALLLMVTLVAAPPAEAGPCEKSARLARKACGFDVKDDLYETRAICAHISDAGDR